MLGHEITYLIKKNGSSVSKIAKSLGVAAPFVSAVIYRTRPTLYIREAISAVVNVPVSELWPDTKTTTQQEAA